MERQYDCRCCDGHRPKYSHFFAVIMKKIILGIVVFLILGGGGYWYLEIYMPIQYGKAASALWEQFETAMTRDPELTAVNFNDEKDYVGALQILRRRLEAAEKTRNELILLRSSRTTQGIHGDFLFVLEGYLAVTADAVRRAEFFADAVTLTKIFQPDPPSLNSEIATMRQYQDYFTSAVPRATSAGDALFTEEPPPLHGDVSFAELKTSWESVKPAFGTMLSYILKQNSAMRMKGYSPSRPTQEETDAQNTLSVFGQMLDSAMRQNTTRGILSYSGIKNLGGITEEEFETRFKKLKTEMENLKNKTQ